MNDNKKGRTSLKWTFFITAFLPLIVLVIALAILGSSFLSRTISYEVKEQMKNISAMVINDLDTMYPGSYTVKETPDIFFFKGEHMFNSDFEYIDKIHKLTGCDISVCYLNSAVITTIKDKDNNRRIGYQINETVMADVLEKGKPVFYDDVYIDKDKIYVYYSPIKDSSGEIIGMIGVSELVARASERGVNPILFIVIIAGLGIIIALYLIFKFSKKQIYAIEKIQEYLKKLSNGDFNAELDYSVATRKDEIGLIGESAKATGYSLRKMVQEDQLTSLFNRRVAYKNFDKTIRKYIYQGVKFCVALGDIDFFKKVNDTYGHDAGDRVLIEVAHTIKEFMQTRGYVIRWGGEEILMIFDKQNSKLEEVAAELEELLNKIRALDIMSDDQLIKVTMTMGVTECSPSDKEMADLDKEELEKWIRKRIDEYVVIVDEKLYYGKEHGRNQVVSNIVEAEATETVPAPKDNKSTNEKTEESNKEATENVSEENKPETEAKPKKRGRKPKPKN